MKNKTLIALAFGALSLGFGAVANAQSITNGDFSDGLTGWTTVSTDGSSGTDALGPENGSGGADYAFIWHSASDTQDIDFHPDTEYTLTFEVASRNIGYAFSGAPYIIVDDGDGIVTQTPQSSSDINDNPQTGAANFTYPDGSITGSFQTVTVNFTTTTGGEGYITLGNNYGGTPPGFDTTSDYTGVSLSGIALEVPEPSAWALSLVGVLGFVFVLRSRRSNS